MFLRAIATPGQRRKPVADVRVYHGENPAVAEDEAIAFAHDRRGLLRSPRDDKTNEAYRLSGSIHSNTSPMRVAQACSVCSAPGTSR